MELQALLDRAKMASDRKPRRIGSDLILAAVVISVVAMMILPMPMFMLDALVAVNISIGVMLVLMSIYIKKALQFSAFPSVLLISTLFRLALSVATTRMILMEGDAGAIIDTFGGMVAGGNLVVGLVVFLIITLVQFLVIAKGAERVAEVGARFTLDAMPGKQMSIDSDLRSGLIEKTEARTKRRELELESKLHGSMDGAMKFVKGDAIAGIVIIVINLLGGLSIGIFQLSMSAGAAMQKYSILTIGDGLVAQIPALLGAMSAGLIVTRVTDSESDVHLGDSIGQQFFAIPRVLIVTGGICYAGALIPGFPSSTFLLLGTILGLTGALLIPTFRRRFDRAAQPAFNTFLKQRQDLSSDVAETALQANEQAVPLFLAVPIACAHDGQDQSLRVKVEQMLNERRIASGVNLPTLRFHWTEQDNSRWTLHAYEVPIASGVISPEDQTAEDRLVEQCSSALRRQTTLFIGTQEASNLMSQAGETMPDIVKEALRAVPTQNVAMILKKLVEEEISIRNMRGILESLVQAGQFEKDVDNLVEYARMSLARQICHRIAPEDRLNAVGLDPVLEEKLTQSLKKVRETPQLVMDPQLRKSLISALQRAIEEGEAAAVIVPVPLRRHVRTMLAPTLFDVPVLSYAEIVGSLELTFVKKLNEADLNAADSKQLLDSENANNEQRTPSMATSRLKEVAA
jgi:type III secretion protein V